MRRDKRVMANVSLMLVNAIQLAAQEGRSQSDIIRRVLTEWASGRIARHSAEQQTGPAAACSPGSQQTATAFARGSSSHAGGVSMCSRASEGRSDALHSDSLPLLTGGVSPHQSSLDRNDARTGFAFLQHFGNAGNRATRTHGRNENVNGAACSLDR
jgi:hypothetical protein